MQRHHIDIFLFEPSKYSISRANTAPCLSDGDDHVTLAAVLAGEAQVALRDADLAERVEMAEGHPEEALVHLQQVLLPRQPEKGPELLVPRPRLQPPRRKGGFGPTRKVRGGETGEEQETEQRKVEGQAGQEEGQEIKGYFLNFNFKRRK